MRSRLLALLVGALLVFLVLAPSASAITRGLFGAEVTIGVGAEVTLHTRRAVAAEMQTEGGGARNNPFNTTRKMPGSTDFNWVHVQNYPTPGIGVEATIKTIKEPGHGYEKIRRRLRSNAPAAAIVKGFGESEWGTFLPLALAVLSDIQHDRTPNTLRQLEARGVTP